MKLSPDLKEFRSQVTRAVDSLITKELAHCRPGEVIEVIRYATSDGGGHSWRATAAMAAARIFEPNSGRITLPMACAVELGHAASLMLDDLPSMDNAKTRRGRPCPHLIFPRWAVDLAPPTMISLAYKLALGNQAVPHKQRVQAVLAACAAALDLAAGQTMDMGQLNEGSSLEEILECTRLKSAAAFAAAAKCGAITMGASEEDIRAAEQCGVNLGMAYQIIDDVADVNETSEGMGKDVGRDQARGKPTVVDRLGINQSLAMAREYRQSALDALGRFGPEADLLRALVSRIEVKLDSPD